MTEEESYAAANYINRIVDSSEFFEDYERFLHAEKLVRKIFRKRSVNYRLALNHFVILFSVFSPDCVRSIFLKRFDSKYWPILKSFLISINRCPEGWLEATVPDINTLKEINNELSKNNR